MIILISHETCAWFVAWDQSDKFMKLYVTMKGVQRLDKDLVKTEYKTR